MLLRGNAAEAYAPCLDLFDFNGCGILVIGKRE
jgi:hypothetical protein